MSPMQRALGADWERLPPALKAHHGAAPATDRGWLDIHYPSAMQPLLWLLAGCGVLVSRKGRQVRAEVGRDLDGERLHWRRTLVFGDGDVRRFDSVWAPSGPGRFIEWVLPWLGLEMQPAWVDHELQIHGLRFVLRLGRRQLSWPQWLGPGRTLIVETALDEHRFAMDFRMVHPWCGELFRYAGRFTAGG